MTYFESIKKYIESGYKPIDNTCNGKCTKCGECCGHILPITQKDANRIQEYVMKNKIRIQKHILIMQNKLSCPYYTGNKEKGCSIYEARPNICRYFKCNKWIMNREEYENLKGSINVDMWEFALFIEKEMDKQDGSNKKTRKAIK